MKQYHCFPPCTHQLPAYLWFSEVYNGVQMWLIPFKCFEPFLKSCLTYQWRIIPRVGAVVQSLIISHLQCFPLLTPSYFILNYKSNLTPSCLKPSTAPVTYKTKIQISQHGSNPSPYFICYFLLIPSVTKISTSSIYPPTHPANFQISMTVLT